MLINWPITANVLFLTLIIFLILAYVKNRKDGKRTALLLRNAYKYAEELNQTLAQIAKSSALFSGYLKKVADIITQKGCNVLKTSRLEVWRETDGKGYTAADIVEQLAKLDEAGIEYYLVYMTGLSGKENGQRNALNTADVLNQISPYFVENPYFLNIDSLTLFLDTELHKMAQRGDFAPAGEKERLEELIALLQNL